MKQKWLKLNPGKKTVCLLQAVLTVAAIILYIALQGNVNVLICGVFLCLVTVVSVLYAEEMFQHKIRRKVADPKTAIPSPMELFSRWVSWILCTALSVGLFILGLTGM